MEEAWLRSGLRRIPRRSWGATRRSDMQLRGATSVAGPCCLLFASARKIPPAQPRQYRLRCIQVNSGRAFCAGRR
eukprot:13384700-Alexandrium_andersonii.AAC.1